MQISLLIICCLKSGTTLHERVGVKKQALSLLYPNTLNRTIYFFLTTADLFMLAVHFVAKACKSFKRLSRSAPSAVTM